MKALMPDKSITEVSLADYAGKWVVILFFPLDFSFVCPTEIIAFSDAAEDFENAETQVLAASCDSEFAHLAWVNTPRSEGGLGDINIPILADFEKKVASSYGILLDGGGDAGVPLRGTFIISPTGILRQMIVNDLPVGRSVNEVLRLVKAFQFTEGRGEVCPANWRPGQEGKGAETGESNDDFSRMYDPANTEGVRQRVTIARQNAISSSSSRISRRWRADHADLMGSCVHIFNEYRLLVQTYPVRTKAITSCIIGILGEILGGAISARRDNRPFGVDAKRVGIFGLYGLVITGPVLHYWYAFLEQLTRGMGLKDLTRLFVKLVIDRGIFGPPFVLLTVSFIQFLQNNFNFGRAGQSIRRTYGAVLLSNEKFWTVAQILNFGVVPVDMQLLYVNIASIAWNTLLSLAS